jgi:hypothetical protein
MSFFKLIIRHFYSKKKVFESRENPQNQKIFFFKFNVSDLILVYILRWSDRWTNTHFSERCDVEIVLNWGFFVEIKYSNDGIRTCDNLNCS